ncbi:MAG: ATP synthase F1 subunit delta [Planctomycetes bacterium]|nr:ATP synthase F1 subunit delta [Planctomycetota bacterium]
METTGVSRIYAQALFDAAAEKNLLADVADEVEALRALDDTLPNLRDALSAPVLSAGKKRAMLERGFKGKVSDLTFRFLALLVVKGRYWHLPDICLGFRELLDEKMGRKRVKVRTAVKLEEATAAAVRAGLSARLGGEVVLEERVMPDIIGGIVVIHGDSVLDASVVTHLREIRRDLREARLDASRVLFDN